MSKVGRPGIDRQKLPQKLRDRSTKTDSTTAEYLRQAAEVIHKQNNQIYKLQRLVHHYENDYDYEEVEA